MRDEFRSKQTSRPGGVAGIPNARPGTDRGGLHRRCRVACSNKQRNGGRPERAVAYRRQGPNRPHVFRGFYADGNIVVIEQRLRATLANGNAYDNDYCFVLELENGLIRRVREYMDTAKGNRMVFGAG